MKEFAEFIIPGLKTVEFQDDKGGTRLCFMYDKSIPEEKKRFADSKSMKSDTKQNFDKIAHLYQQFVIKVSQSTSQYFLLPEWQKCIFQYEPGKFGIIPCIFAPSSDPNDMKDAIKHFCKKARAKLGSEKGGPLGQWFTDVQDLSERDDLKLCQVINTDFQA